MRNPKIKFASTETTIKQKKHHVVSVRLNDDQYAKALAKANESGRKLSDYWRRTLLNTTIKAIAKPDDMVILRQIGSMANNLNQLAKRANEAGFKLVKWEVESLCKNIKALYYRLSHDWKD